MRYPQTLTPQQLNELWNVPYHELNAIQDHEKAYKFHMHCASRPNAPERDKDVKAANSLVRAILSNADDREPPEPEPCNCN